MSKIIGATVGTTSPRPDWNQTDPKKADYIKNKPEGAGGGSGTDGITPHIGANGNWWIGDTDTGVKAEGKDGKDGRGIKSVARTSGNGAAGTTDTYTITYTDNTTSTFTVYNGKNGTNGTDGTSVTVKSVSESTADGGSNVVTFSDGKTLTVKNGKTGAAGKDGKIPVKGTDYWTPTDKAEIVSDVIKELPVNDGGNIPDYVKVEAEEVANKVLSVRNAYSFVFGAISDIHSTGSDASTLHAGQGIREIDKLTTLDACLNFGDGIDSYFEDVNADSFHHIRKCVHDVARTMPYIQMQGNHDQLKTDTTENGQQKYFAYIGANNIGTVTDWDNRFRNYGYRDFPDQRMRVIYLNSVDVSEGENTDDCWLTAMQLSWLVNTALDFTDKEGWTFIVGCHHPLNWWYMDNLLTILNAYKGKASGSVTVDGTTVNYNFSNATAEFIAHFHGHIHNFRVETLGANGVLSITIPNACFGRNNEYGTQYDEDMANEYGDADENGNQRQFNKTTGTAEDTAFNVVVIDRTEQKIHCFNYGAGIDRVVDFVGSVVEPDAPVKPDEPVEIVNILDTIGYTDGKRCKTSSVSLGDLTGATAFGWYDCSSLSANDVVRIYLPNGIPTASSQAYAAHLTSADETTSKALGDYYQGWLNVFTNMFESVSYADNIITLTGRLMESEKTKFRLSAQANGADCIMTLNQEITV